MWLPIRIHCMNRDFSIRKLVAVVANLGRGKLRVLGLGRRENVGPLGASNALEFSFLL